MRIVVSAIIFGVAALLLPLWASAEGTKPAASGIETITVRLSNFAFDPEHLRLKANAPIRLRLVSEGGRHDFSAPAFFASSSFPSGSSAPPDGDIAVGSDETVEIIVVPQKPGTYPLKCTHFLHSLFGMHDTIEVIP
jgi:uncharacterized cupredoxin-like copper-binding protein